ncbi:hypothetical protein [Celeribacter baekdonensis]|uniref:Uncharacterized protein n=1 Tax=Celeribacter baekdonensis TaxID=875171 RepID=A0A2R4M747_9RHOB|nr:hypothetical protein [Celeribacter baekdonensis]AVW93030.1 hypothetical protein DA792_19705 [Celeribacter baekdonensis]
MPKTNDAALDAFIAVKTEIDAMLARLAALSADHFDYCPEDVNWGHVGTLNHYHARLCEITDMACSARAMTDSTEGVVKA